jgi:hypothetical protein
MCSLDGNNCTCSGALLAPRYLTGPFSLSHSYATTYAKSTVKLLRRQGCSLKDSMPRTLLARDHWIPPVAHTPAYAAQSIFSNQYTREAPFLAVAGRPRTAQLPF